MPIFSDRIVDAPRDLYAEIQQVRPLGLTKATDAEVWAYAADNGFAVVRKDSDFRQRSFFFGAPAQSYLGRDRKLLDGSYRTPATRTEGRDCAIYRRSGRGIIGPRLRKAHVPIPNEDSCWDRLA